MSEAGSLWGLFISSFLASTLLPGGSEGVLVWLHQHQAASTFSLLLVATLGNTLGGMTSWGIGYWLRRRFPLGGLEKPHQRQALRWLERHGSPLLLFAWLPVVGDPLCVAAGWLKFPWWSSALFIALGKGARYALLLWVSSQAM